MENGIWWDKTGKLAAVNREFPSVIVFINGNDITDLTTAVNSSQVKVELSSARRLGRIAIR